MMDRDDTLIKEMHLDDEMVELQAHDIELVEEVTPQQQIEDLTSQLDAMRDNWLRSMADSENIRKRAQREKEDAMKYGVISFARDMVGIADNLSRALQSCPQSTDEGLPDSIKSLVVGVDMIARETLAAFEKQGIKKISPLNEKFDPNFHQAMFEIETNDQPVGTVVQVLQEGYMLHDRLLRAAMVGVAKAVVVPTEILAD
ncbi:MAG: nucleotide exchange factor GrpE [Alphaproteobacteria bacterium]|nr:nucleotide exchange factor GrpE [Alphaproteobacteria bacterium]